MISPISRALLCALADREKIETDCARAILAHGDRINVSNRANNFNTLRNERLSTSTFLNLPRFSNPMLVLHAIHEKSDSLTISWASIYCSWHARDYIVYNQRLSAVDRPRKLALSE